MFKARSEMDSTVKSVGVQPSRISHSSLLWNSVLFLNGTMKDRSKDSTEKKTGSVCLVSPTIRSYLAKTFWQVSLLNGGPLYWNGDRVGRQRNKRNLIHFYLNFIYASLYTAFVIFRSIQVQLDDSQSQAVKIFMRFQAVYFGLCPLLSLAVILNRLTIPALINGILDTADACEGK